MPETSPRDVVDRALAGDDGAFRELVDEHQGYAYALAFRLLCDPDEAREAVHESFLRVWRALRRYDQRLKFTTWLYTIVTNVCLDRLRVRKRMLARFPRLARGGGAELLPSSSTPEKDYASVELAAIIGRLTADLSERERVVFTLRDLQDLPLEEVAAITGMSGNNVKVTLSHARQRMRKMLRTRYGITGT